MQTKLLQFRTSKKLMQKDIAKYLLCHHATYSKYERGTLPIPLEVMVKLSSFYGVKVDDLLELPAKFSKNI